jgi:hypothetical protein
LEGGGKRKWCKPPADDPAAMVEYYMARYSIERENLKDALLEEFPKKEAYRIYKKVCETARLHPSLLT